MTEIRNTIDRTSTIMQQQEQDQQYKNAGGDYNYNNNYPARARARGSGLFRAPEMADLEEPMGELPGSEIMEKIAEAYRENISQQITKAAAGIIERALSSGMEPATVILAIEETGMASRPSPYYLSAVLRNWAQNGVVVSRAREIGVRVTEARPWWR